MKTINYLIRNKRAVLLLAILSIVLVCCKSTAPVNKSATSQPSLAPNYADVTVAQAQWQGATLANLTDGYNIFSTKCIDCHEMKMPQDFSIDNWNDILPKMGRKAHLDSNQYASVYHYILAKRETILAGKK